MDDSVKDLAESILKLASQGTSNPNVLRWLISNNIYKEEAEERVIAMLNGDVEDSGPDILIIETAKTVVTLLFDQKDQDTLRQSEQLRWLVADF